MAGKADLQGCQEIPHGNEGTHQEHVLETESVPYQTSQQRNDDGKDMVDAC